MRKSSGQSDDIKNLSYFISKIIPHIGSTVNPLLSQPSLEEEIYETTHKKIPYTWNFSHTFIL